MTQDVAKALSAIKESGAFATRATAPADDLRLEVKDVGTIRFPVSRTKARKLRGVARQAGFGLRDKTLVDKNVRDTWEIARSRVKIDQRRWKKTLDPLLERIKKELGLPTNGKLKAQLYKMLVYEPGQFFMPHQDSEKTADMLGTMTVVLPSEHKGGSTVIEHRGEKITYRSSGGTGEKLTFIAFYSDCHHEVRPIKDGYRVVLVYNLNFDGPSISTAHSNIADSVDRLAKRVNAHFTTPIPANGYSEELEEPPDKLVYLLDHEYTQKSLGWNRLKNGDRLRTAALREIAERLDCEIFLALADIRETWSCEEDDYDWDYRRRRYDRYDYEEKDAESYDLIELFEDDIELRNWIDRSGKPVKSTCSNVVAEEVCFTKASVDCDPFKSEHEGFMGNYGNTVDRWYHRAAVVLWPRSRSFAIRAKLSPNWAIDQLWKLLKTGEVQEARDKAQSLLPFWSRWGSNESGKPFLTKTLRVAAALDDAKLAETLIAPFQLRQLGAQAMPHFVALLKSHGLTWCRQRFLQWADDGPHYYRDSDKKWLKFMPTFCRELCVYGADTGTELAQWVAAHQWLVTKEQCKRQLEDRESPHAQSELSELCKKLIWVIDSCVAAGANETHQHILKFLTGAANGYPVKCLVAALQECCKSRSPKEVKALRLDALHRHCVAELSMHLAAPVRNADDWSITPPQKCTCELCQRLTEFLAHSARTKFEWPIATQKRQHVHQQLDEYMLPVTHTTRRQGSPFTLVLVKTKDLFAREAELRKKQQQELSWLTRQQRSFVTTATL